MSFEYRHARHATQREKRLRHPGARTVAAIDDDLRVLRQAREEHLPERDMECPWQPSPVELQARPHIHEQEAGDRGAPVLELVSRHLSRLRAA